MATLLAVLSALAIASAVPLRSAESEIVHALAPANCPNAQQLIAQAEGFRQCTYTDTTGHKTICYGFNLDAGGARAKVEAVGGNWDSVYNHGGCLTTSQCAILLNNEVRSAAAAELGIFGSQCACIDAVLTDMTYNLGAAGMASFTTFIGLIKQHKWSAAASDLKGTAWCGQVKSRCTRDTQIVAAGC
jgi:lysozyme